MHTAVTELSGAAQVIAATLHHPYARLTTGGDMAVRGYAADGVVAWLAAGGRGPALYSLGDQERVVRLVTELAEQGTLSGVRRLHLPRGDHAALTAHLPVADPDHWEFRWTTTFPPPQPGEERVVRLGPDADPAVDALLDTAHTGSFTRPGSPWVRRWYGIRDGTTLVACGADRSRGGAGELAGIAVHPEVRGRGLGTALTATMTRGRFEEYGVVALGVMADRPRTARLYHRLGFTYVEERTSVDIT